MPTPPSVPAVSDAELEVLKALWQSGPATVRQVDALLKKRKKRWAYNTVLTLLSRLKEKGYVAIDRGEPAHVFRAILSREQLIRRDLRELADRVCDGTASPLVHALVSAKNLSAQDIADLRRLLDQLESQE